MFLVTIVGAKEYFKRTPGVLRRHVKPKHLDALMFTVKPVIEDSMGCKLIWSWHSSFDAPERTATVKPVFSQNEMVVDFDYCIIAAGATSVLFASGAGHCSEFATRDAKRLPRSCHENILRHLARCIWAVQRILPFHEFQDYLDECMLLENGLVPHLIPLFEFHDSNIWRRTSRHLRFRGGTMCFRSRSVGLRSDEVSQFSSTNQFSLFHNSYHSSWSFVCHFLMFWEMAVRCACLCWFVSPIFHGIFECGEVHVGSVTPKVVIVAIRAQNFGRSFPMSTASIQLKHTQVSPTSTRTRQCITTKQQVFATCLFDWFILDNFVLGQIGAGNRWSVWLSDRR